MSPPSPHFDLVKALFDACADQAPAARERLIAEAALDPPAAGELRSLLKHHDAARTADAAFLQGSAAQHLAAGSGHAARVGERLGAWEIVRPLGAGGMGEVFEARRADGSFDGRAAIKLLKRGMDSAAVLRRFSLEQQALARLNHPHVARLFDAGASADGLPYFVMEFVIGVPIDEAVRGLPLAQRLALFRQLAEAVAHAHRNLLVHRDLKPGNVLVDTNGQVKLLDFGIAKALDPLDGADPVTTLDTTLGSLRPFTPNYASPEQVRGEPVSTATDIYSLGVLLYQMLTGVRPTGRAAATPAQAARSVLEETPTRPSSLGSDQVSDPDWLANRKTLQGDLDNILLKALEKPVERRYPSVEALAADIRATLNGYPVSARAPRIGYLALKFVTRNRVAVGTAAVALLAVLGGLATAAWQAHEARLARDDAQRQLGEIKRLTTDLVFRFGDALTRLPGGMKAEEAMLQRTLASLDNALKSAPADADLMALVASALGRLAELQGNEALAAPQRAPEAQATVQRGLALGEAAWPSRHADWRFASWHLRTRCIQSMLLRSRGQPAEGLATLEAGILRASQVLALPLTPEGRAHMVAVRGVSHMLSAPMNLHATQPHLNRPADALRHFEAAEADYRSLLADTTLLVELERDAAPGDTPARDNFNHQLASIQIGKATTYGRLDDVPRMRSLAGEAYQRRLSNLQREPANLYWRDGVITEGIIFATALVRSGEASAALAVTQRAWDMSDALAREQGPTSKWAGDKASLAPVHAQALAAAGRHAEAVTVVDIAITTLSAIPKISRSAADQRRLAGLQVTRAASMAAVGQTEAATKLLTQAVEALRPLTAQAAIGRDADLSLAQGLIILARLESSQATALRAEAATALRRAAALQALGEDHLKLVAEAT